MLSVRRTKLPKSIGQLYTRRLIPQYAFLVDYIITPPTHSMDTWNKLKIWITKHSTASYSFYPVTKRCKIVIRFSTPVLLLGYTCTHYNTKLYHKVKIIENSLKYCRLIIGHYIGKQVFIGY